MASFGVSSTVKTMFVRGKVKSMSTLRPALRSFGVLARRAAVALACCSALAVTACSQRESEIDSTSRVAASTPEPSAYGPAKGIEFDGRTVPAKVGDYELISDDFIWEKDGNFSCGPAYMMTDMGNLNMLKDGDRTTDTPRSIRREWDLRGMRQVAEENGYGNPDVSYIWYGKGWRNVAPSDLSPEFPCIMVQMEQYAGSIGWANKWNPSGATLSKGDKGYRAVANELGSDAEAQIVLDGVLEHQGIM